MLRNTKSRSIHQEGYFFWPLALSILPSLWTFFPYPSLQIRGVCILYVTFLSLALVTVFPAALSTKANGHYHKMDNKRTFREFTLLALGFFWETYKLRTNK